jgi:hypothetical protein
LEQDRTRASRRGEEWVNWVVHLRVRMGAGGEYCVWSSLVARCGWAVEWHG